MTEPLFDIVDRPVSRSPIVTALLETAVSGRAIRVQLNGEPIDRLRNRYAQTLKARGFVIRTRTDGEFFIMWAEKKESV